MTPLIAEANRLIEKLSDLDPSKPADLTYRELTRACKGLEVALVLLERLVGAYEELEAERADLAEEIEADG